MFSSRIRIILIITHTIVAMILFANNQNIWATIILMGGILQLYGYLRYGTVWLASRQLSRQNYSEVKRLLAMIKNPAYLSKSQKGFYYMLQGAADLYHEKNYQAAEINIKKAIEIGVGTTNNKSINHLMLSEISYNQNNLDTALNYVKAAIEIPHNAVVDQELQKFMNEIEDAIKRNQHN